MKTRTVPLIISLTVGIAALGACKQDQNGLSFDDFDADKDGAITSAEASKDKTLVQNLIRADLNRDGVLNREEFDAAMSGSTAEQESQTRPASQDIAKSTGKPPVDDKQ